MSCQLLLWAVLAAAPASAAAPDKAGQPAIALTSMGCDVDDAELRRLLVLELADLPQQHRDFALHVELRCEINRIGILVREPDRGISLQRTLESPEAAVGRERVLALAIRQLIGASFIDLVTGADPHRDEPSEPPHAPEQASHPDPRAAAADSDDPEPADQPASATPDLVARGRAEAAEGAPAPASHPARVDLGLELGGLARALERRPLAAARLGVRAEVALGRRGSLLGLLTSDWTTLAATGGRVHAIAVRGGFGARAWWPLPRSSFAASLGGDVELGWGRVLAVAEPGFFGRAIDGVSVEGRAIAGLWARDDRGALGLELAIGGGPRTPVGTVAGGESVSLGGLFVGVLVGGAVRVR